MPVPEAKTQPEPRLPTFERGTRLRLQSIALVVLVLGMLLYQLVLENRRAARLIGITFGDEKVGLTIAAVDPKGPAARAGIRPHDRMVTAAGQPIRDHESYDLATRAFAGKRAVPFVVDRGGQRLTLQ